MPDTAIDAASIREVERLAKASTAATVIKQPGGEPEGIYLIATADGKVERKVTGPDWRDHKLTTPAELAGFINTAKSDACATFVDESGAVYVYDLADRRHTATSPLTLSPQYLTLRELACGKMFPQADFVRLLRIALRGTLPPDSNLLSLVRNLKFNMDSETAVQIQHGRESMGKQINAAVTGESAIPEEITLMLPVFENHPFLTRISCAIEVLVREQQFRLTPFPGEMQRAMDIALGNVTETLMREGAPPVYLGTP